jgi:hypothetical protein
MKRDMELVRQLLLRIDDDPQLDGTREFMYETPDELGIEGRSVEEVGYHIALLIEAGYVDGAVTWAANPLQVIRRLTWDGHEFLDDIRDPGIWSKTKERLKGLPAVGLTIVAEIAKSEVKKHLGLP